MANVKSIACGFGKEIMIFTHINDIKLVTQSTLLDISYHLKLFYITCYLAYFFFFIAQCVWFFRLVSQGGLGTGLQQMSRKYFKPYMNFIYFLSLNHQTWFLFIVIAVHLRIKKKMPFVERFLSLHHQTYIQIHYQTQSVTHQAHALHRGMAHYHQCQICLQMAH